jgi:vitamin B12 transporter
MRPAVRAAAFGLAAAALAARGEDVPHDDEPRKRVKAELAVVSSRLDTPDPSSTVRVVTREEIEHFPGRGLAELLQWVAGVDARRRGVEGVQADISIRGADYNGTLILVDGQPMNDPQSNHHSASLDLPLDAIDHVEILFGAGASLWGADAVGGVVNVVTRGAKLGRARAQLEGRIARGTDSLDSGGLRLASKVGERVTLAADWGRSEWAGFRDDTEFAQDFVRGSARWETASGPVSASFGYGRRQFGAWAFYGTAYPDQQEGTQIRTAAASASLALGGWTLTPSLSWRSYSDDFVLVRTNPAFYENLSDTARLDGRLYARHTVLGGTAVVGLEAGGQSVASTNLGDHSRSRTALFLEFGRPFDTAAPQGGGFRVGLRGDDYSDFGSHLSPHAGVWYAPVAALRLRASAGTAFRVPTYTELYYSDPQNTGNPALVPEEATNVEAGATFLHGAFVLDAVGFYRHGTDLIDFVRSSPDAPYAARNIRTVDTSGFETTASWHGRKEAPLSRVSLSASYVFADLAALADAAGGATQGKYLLDPLHVKWDLVLGGMLPLEIAALTRISYFARPSFASGVWLWDVRLDRDLLQGEIFDVYVEGRNLGDRKYEEVPGVPLPGRILLAGFRATW